MSRDSQGLYTLPPGNPVVAGTLIEAEWANTTMSDIAQALTNSLPRDGSAPMTGQLTLSASNPTQARHATSKAYVDQFMAFATGMPLGAVFAFAAGTAPNGYLLCNGQAVSRTTYDQLFALIGTTWGSGDNATTFNVPDLRDWFIRGKSDSRQIGSQQLSAFGSHLHPLVDPGHNHTVTNPSHTHTSPVHNHTLTDPQHFHATGTTLKGSGGDTFQAGSNGLSFQTDSASTGITLADTAVTVDAATQNTTLASATTGVTSGAAGDTETRPQNVAMHYFIKAVNDSVNPATSLAGITSSDTAMIDINNSNVYYPELDIKSNVAFGTVKLDSGGRVPVAQMPITAQQLLGYFDASGGQNPSEKYPAQTFISGNTYIVSVGGTIAVIDPTTLIAGMVAVNPGYLLTYITDSFTNPTGWYYAAPSATVQASEVGYVPSGKLTTHDVQAALDEVAAFLPVGDIVGTTDSQTLTNKTIDGSLNTITNLPAARIISVNDTTPGLRITQTGTGDALLVEDVDNPDASPFRITADGVVTIGQLTPPAGTKLNTYLAAADIAVAEYANYVRLDANNTSGSVAKTAIQGQVYVGSAFAGTSVVTAIQGTVTNNGTANPANIFGGKFSCNNTGAGTVTTATGINVPAFANSGGGAITNLYGVLISNQTVASTVTLGIYNQMAAGTGKWGYYGGGTAPNYFAGDVIFDGKIGLGAGGTPDYGTSGMALISKGAASDPVWGLPNIPVSTTTGSLVNADAGKCVSLAAGITIPANIFAAGDAVSLVNNTAGNLTLTQGSGLTLYLVGTATTGNRTLAQRGLVTIWFLSPTVAYIQGGGLT